MNSLEKLIKNRQDIEAKLNHRFQHPELLFLAFVHRSYVNEHKEMKEHNERLEFLGDSVLGLIIAEYLYETFPDLPEGNLSQLRARIVDASSCMALFQKLNLSEYILLGKGEAQSLGRGKESIGADVFEAIIGAIYLDGGFLAAKQFFMGLFAEELTKIVQMPSRNFKAELQDYSQKKYQKPPLYKVLKETGPDHSKTFFIAVVVGDAQIAEGSGHSKKEAEQNAAYLALQQLSRTE